jgi:hypothetical protein
MSIQITKRPFDRVFSGNPVHYELFSNLAVTDADVSFEVRLKFKYVTDLVYTQIVTLPYSPINGYATIDLKEILDGVLEFELPQFGVDEATPWLSAKQTGKFYLEYREITSANPNPDWDSSEAAYPCFVLKGGLNDFKYQGNNFWLNYYDINFPFLTWQYNGRLAAIDERMYLTWLINTDRAGSSLVVKVFYRDGTVDTTTQVGLSVTTGLIGAIYYIPVGATQLNLRSLDVSKEIWYWTAQIVDVNDSSTYSEIFKYELDNRNDYNGITLNYRNSLGGLDSVRVRGSVEKKLDYNFSELEATITPNYFDGHFFQPQKIVSGNLEQVVYSGNIGLLKKEEQERLRDAQMLRETWTAKNKKWVPLNILTRGFTLVKTEDQRWSMPIDFTLGYNGAEYYTPESVDLGEGVFTANVCLAYMSPMSVVRDAITADDAWVVNGTENDPQTASIQLEYRVVKNSDSSVLMDWTVGDWGIPLPFNVPNDSGTYTVEVRAVCTNDVYGRTTTVQLDSTTGSGVPTGGSLFSSILNTTGGAGSYSIDIDGGAEVVTGSIGSHNEIAFDVTNVTDVTIVVTLGFSPPLVIIESDGVDYSGTLAGGAWTFEHVNIVDGIRVKIY